MKILFYILILCFISGCTKEPETAKEAIEVAFRHLEQGDVDAYFKMTVNAEERFKKLATLDKEKQKKLSELYREIGNDYILKFIEADCDSILNMKRYHAQEGCEFMIGLNHKSDKKKNIELNYYYAMKINEKWKIDFPF